MAGKKKVPPIIRTVDLTKQYGDVTAVDHLNLQIRKGEIFSLLGPNGAGKTTTTLMLLGLTDPTYGRAYIDGMDCTRHALEVKNEVGYLPDKVGFYPSMSGYDNLVFTGMMNGLTEKDAGTRAILLLERVGMTDAAYRHTGTYSRGMLQRLGIADVLMKNPSVIIMDEPTSGIDPEGVRSLTKLIRDLATEEGLTLLISSHDLYQMQKISDRVGIFVKGRMIACGRIEELGRQLMNEGLYMFDFRVERGTEDIWTTDFQNMIRNLGSVTIIGRRADGTIHVESKTDIQKALVTVLVNNDYTIRDMHQQGGDLDEIYRRYFEKAEAEEEEQNGPGKHSDHNGKSEHIKKISKKLAGLFKKTKLTGGQT